MRLARFVLLVTAVSFFGYGLACFFFPRGVAGHFTAYGLAAPAGLIEIRAMYGGLQAGFGLFCLLAGLRPGWTTQGLAAIALVMGGLVLTRCIGMGMEGPAGANPGAAIYEGTTTALALLALARLHAGGRASPV